MDFKGKHSQYCIIKYALNFRANLFYILIIYDLAFRTRLAMMGTVWFAAVKDVAINITLKKNYNRKKMLYFISHLTKFLHLYAGKFLVLREDNKVETITTNIY